LFRVSITGGELDLVAKLYSSALGFAVSGNLLNHAHCMKNLSDKEGKCHEELNFGDYRVWR